MDQQTLDTAQLPRRVYTAHILMNFKIKINKDYLRILCACRTFVEVITDAARMSRGDLVKLLQNTNLNIEYLLIL